jgi:hypothetical protein
MLRKVVVKGGRPDMILPYGVETVTSANWAMGCELASGMHQWPSFRHIRI